MIDITESDIEYEYSPEREDDFQKFFIVIHQTIGDKLDFAEQLGKQILQNQKDAQEYRKFRNQPFWQSINMQQVPFGTILDYIIKLQNNQSQHKKLVDAIQNEINYYQKEIERLQPHEDQYQDRAGHSGLLDMSDICDKKWHEEYCDKKEMLDKLQNLLKESEKE